MNDWSDGTYLFTDGGATTDKRGGWAWVLVENGEEVRRGTGGARGTTNQKMEIEAAIQGLTVVHPDVPVTIVADSAYLVNCFNDMPPWRELWEQRGWLNAKHRPVENEPLWRRLFEVVDARTAKTQWLRVPGHSGDQWNDLVDRLATKSRPTRTEGFV